MNHYQSSPISTNHAQPFPTIVKQPLMIHHGPQQGRKSADATLPRAGHVCEKHRAGVEPHSVARCLQLILHCHNKNSY